MFSKFSTIAALTVTLFSGPASAAFIGAYDASNWSQTIIGGSIDLTGAPASVGLTSSDDGSGDSKNADFTIAAAATGSVSFDWAYTTQDFSSLWDPFGWVLNGTYTELTDGLTGSQNGATSFLVNAGDVFGFRIYTTDSLFGSSTAIVRNFNFSGPAPMPEPASLALLAIGLAGLGAVRRRKMA